MKKLLTLLLLLTYSAYADKMQLGIGPAVLSYPDYIGSKSRNTLTLPLPYIRYQSSFLNIDEEGLNAKLFGVKGLSLNLSVGGSLPVDSEDNTLRQGMEDLDFIVEAGPNLIYKMYNDENSALEFQFPIRAAYSTDLSNLSYQGITSNPHFKYTYFKSNYAISLSSGLIYSNAQYNAYFYDVQDRHVTNTRAKYESKSGFGGFKTKLGFVYQKDAWVLGAFASYYNISSATFKDSPLVETNNALYFGTSLSYVFYTSSN